MAQQGAALQNYNNELVKCKFCWKPNQQFLKILITCFNFKQVLRICVQKEMIYKDKS